jgi:hypothetical protein
MYHTNHLPQFKVMDFVREIEIPELPKGWVLDSVNILKEGE